jgi:TonB family protein
MKFVSMRASKENVPIWALAVAGAIALHLGCVALAVANMQFGDPEEALGSRAIEIGVELLAPRSENSDLPPGPDADATAASPEVVEQKAVLKETDLPQAVPTETEDPDRVVTPNESKKPAKEDPEVAAAQAAPSTLSVATEATAMPSSTVIEESPRSVSPAQGIGESARRVRTTWQKELVAHFDRHKRYPADRAQRAAEIVVSFVLDRTGRVLSSNVVKSSGDASFDAAALAMIQRSDPVPPPPPIVADEGLTFSLPVLFRVKK